MQEELHVICGFPVQIRVVLFAGTIAQQYLQLIATTPETSGIEQLTLWEIPRATSAAKPTTPKIRRGFGWLGEPTELAGQSG
jgi:hypothetical protein